MVEPTECLRHHIAKFVRRGRHVDNVLSQKRAVILCGSDSSNLENHVQSTGSFLSGQHRCSCVCDTSIFSMISILLLRKLNAVLQSML